MVYPVASERSGIEERQGGRLARMFQRILGENGLNEAMARTASESVEAVPGATATLRRGELYIVPATGTSRITCDRGTAWITCPGRFCDYILQPGESLLLRGEGKILVSGGLAGVSIRIDNAQKEGAGSGLA